MWLYYIIFKIGYSGIHGDILLLIFILFSINVSNSINILYLKYGAEVMYLKYGVEVMYLKYGVKITFFKSDF